MFCVMWGVRNGEMVPRKWLMYSDSVDSLFCFCCKLFFNESTLWTTRGFDDWTHTSTALEKHEKNQKHFKAFGDWKDLEFRLKINSTLDHISQKIRDEQVAYWRNVLPGPPLRVCKVCGCTLGFFREAALVSIFKLFFLLNENFSSFWVMYLDF